MNIHDVHDALNILCRRDTTRSSSQPAELLHDFIDEQQATIDKLRMQLKAEKYVDLTVRLNELQAEGERLQAEGERLQAEGERLQIEINKAEVHYLQSKPWVPLRKFEDGASSGWCWIAYKGAVHMAYYKKEVHYSLFFFHRHSTSAYPSECITHVMPGRKPEHPNSYHWPDGVEA